MVLLGAGGISVTTPLRTLVLNAARDAPSLAATFNSSTYNLGIAVGATISSVALASGASYAQLPWLSIGCSLCGLAIIMFAHNAHVLRAAVGTPLSP
jgi:DHA1 family inner membrane transport protein